MIKLLLYIILLGAFITVPHINENEGYSYALKLLLGLIALLCNTFFALYELIQLKFKRLTYITEMENWIDTVRITLIYISLYNVTFQYRNEVEV